MSIEEINSHVESMDIGTNQESSLTWNGRSVQHSRKAPLIQALALMHLAVQKQGDYAVRKLENEICVLRDVIDKEEDNGFSHDKLLNFDFSKLFELMEKPRHACLKIPQFLQTEERIKSLLNISTLSPNESAAEKPLKSHSFPPVVILDPDSPVRSDSSPSPHSTVFEIPGKRLARGTIGGINGIGSNLEDAKGHGHYLQRLSSNYHIEWTHNCSHSIPIDVIEVALLNYQGFSAPAKLLKENWKQFHKTHKNDSGAKYLQFCHSQGALHVRNALANTPKEIRDRVIVVAIAPATIIPKKWCFDSFNYVSKRDPISMIETAWQVGWDASPVHTIAIIAEEAFKELILLELHPDASGIDHEFQSPTFREVIKRHLEQYIEQYGLLQ